MALLWQMGMNFFTNHIAGSCNRDLSVCKENEQPLLHNRVEYKHIL